MTERDIRFTTKIQGRNSTFPHQPEHETKGQTQPER
jgi:hypothetical protein